MTVLSDWAWLVFLLQLSSTGYMIGVIWMVQLVHYPLFSLVHPERFQTYVAEHQHRMGFVVMPFMFIELATAIVIPFLDTPWWSLLEAWVGLGLLVFVWLSTFALQVPAHRRLAQGPDNAALDKLVRSNWLRTAGWTLRGILVLIWFARAFQ